MNQLPLHNALKPLAWLEGIWRTETVGLGKFPTINPFKYCEEVTFTSIGQPMLNYAAQSWHPEKKVPMHREVGFLKIVPNTNAVSFFVAHNFGLTTVEEGEVNENYIELLSTNVTRKTEGSKPPAVVQVSIKRIFTFKFDHSVNAKINVSNESYITLFFRSNVNSNL